MIGQAIGEVLAFGVGVALSPLAIVALVVMLVAPGRGRPPWAFAGAWLLSLATVCTLVVLLADGSDPNKSGAPATWVSIVKILLGLLLVLVGAREWRQGHGSSEAADSPRWMHRLDDATVRTAAGLAVLFAVVKPKNLLLTIGAGVAVAQVGANAAGQAVAVGVFVVLGTLGLGIPLSIHVGMGEQGRSLLIGLRDWMTRENATIIAVLCLLLAAKLLGDAVVALTS